MQPNMQGKKSTNHVPKYSRHWAKLAHEHSQKGAKLKPNSPSNRALNLGPVEPKFGPIQGPNWAQPGSQHGLQLTADLKRGFRRHLMDWYKRAQLEIFDCWCNTSWSANYEKYFTSNTTPKDKFGWMKSKNWSSYQSGSLTPIKTLPVMQPVAYIKPKKGPATSRDREIKREGKEGTWEIFVDDSGSNQGWNSATASWIRLVFRKNYSFFLHQESSPHFG